MFHWTEKNFDRIIAPLIILLLVFLAAACQKEPFWQSARRSISCIVSAADTKAGLITESSLQTEGFVMQAYAEDSWHDNTLPGGTSGSIDSPHSPGVYFGCYVKYDTSKWKTYASKSDATATEYMWLNDVPLTFWCWNGTAAFPSGKEPEYTISTQKLNFGYDVGTTANDDLVFAYNSEKRKFNDKGEIVSEESSGSRTDDKVDIHFYHALSEVNFIICIDGDDSFDPSLVIKDIAIENIKMTGDCVLDGSKCNSTSYSQAFSWSDLSTNGSCSRNFGPQTGAGSTWTDKYTDQGTASEKHYRKTGTSFFVIPQTPGSTAQIKLTFSDNSQRTAIINGDSSTIWSPGKYYTYKLSAHAEDIGFTATLVDWGAGGTSDLNAQVW